MYFVKTTFVRPSEDVPYYLSAYPEVQAMFQSWMNSMTLDVSVENETPLKQVTIAVYDSEAEAQSVIDSLLAVMPTFFDDRDAYCAQNGITITREIL